MKYRALHNNNFEFYNTTSDLIGIVGPGTGTGMVISATSGVVTIGNGTPVDLQIGAVGTTVSMKLMGGGSLTANGSTLSFGQAGDTINLNVAGVTYNLPSNLLTTSTFDMVSIAESLRANNNLSGGGTITVDASYNVLWSSRFIVISNGYGTNFSTNGYFDINCPTSGTITGVGGAANATATASGIPLASWQALYYILPIGSSNTSIPGNFRIASYTSTLDIPYNWVLICVRNGDDGYVYFDNGDIVGASQSSNNWYVPGFTSVSGVGVAQANSTSTGALRVQGGAGISGPLYANRLIASNSTGVAGSTIDATVTNGNWGVNFLARTNGGNYNPLVQTDDSLVYWSNGSQGFGNLVLAPWSSTSTGVRITNTGTVSLPSLTTATAANNGALVVSGGAGIGQNLIVGTNAYIGQTTVNTIGVSTNFVASPAFILGGQTTDNLYMRRQSQGNYAFQTYNGGNSGNITLQPYGGNVTIGGNATIQPSNITVSTLTGMLVVADGVGIGGNLAVNGPIYLGNLGTTFSITTATSGNGTSIRFVSPFGRLDIGSQNTSYTHYDTDRPTHWFNKRIEAGANIIGSWNGDLTIDRASSTISRIRITNGTTISDQPLSVNTNTQATNTLTGALIVAGGVGVGASVYAGNRIGWSSGTNSVAYQFFNYATNSIDVMFG